MKIAPNNVEQIEEPINNQEEVSIQDMKIIRIIFLKIYQLKKLKNFEIFK